MRTVIATLMGITTLALPAGAAAAQFDGKTSEHKNVHLHTNASGVVTRVKIDWMAPCKSTLKYLGATGWSPPFDVSKPGGIRDAGTYTTRTAHPKGATARITARLGALQVSDDAWKGTLDVRVILRRAGKFIDQCAIKGITWTAKRTR
jgi:hypothetical protein